MARRPPDVPGTTGSQGESTAQRILSQLPRLPGTALPRTTGLLLVLAVTLAIEMLLVAGIRIPAPAALLLVIVAYATYLDGLRVGVFAGMVAVAYEVYSFIWRGNVLPDESSPLFRAFGLGLLTLVTVLFIGRFRQRLDALLRKERELLAEAEAKRQALTAALGNVERAQEAIRFQARLLEAVGQAVMASDVDGRIVYWNEPSTTLFGIAAGDAATRVITDIMPDPADVEEPTLVRLRGGGTFHGEIAVRRPDGTSVVALISDSPIRDDAGQTMGLVRVATDVTARKQVERAQQLLADAGAALSASMDYETTIRDVTRLSIRGFADCCVAILVDEGGETWQLEAACVDAAMEEVARDPAWVYRAEAGEAHPIADVMSTGRVQFMPSIDVDALPVDAAWTHWMRRFGFRSAIIAPLVAGGDAVGAIAFYRAPGGTPYDANDLRLAEDLAIRAATAIQQSRLFESALIANRAKSDFLAVMSHELRTPLTTITGYTDLLLAGVPEPLPERHTGYVNRIRIASSHLLSLIEQILVYARLELGRERTHPVRIHVAEVLREAAGLVEPVAAERGIGFRVEQPDASGTIESDPTKLRQILLNLLANAVKFTDAGEVILSAAQQNGAVVFTVSDTGIGISPEHLTHIFDPFWQVDQSSTRRAGGAGLGLSVARRLAQVLGGDVTVESRHGNGTVFRLRLPQNWSSETGASPPVPRESGVSSAARLDAGHVHD